MMNILVLPDEMLINIASMLSLDDLKSLSLTCRRFNEVIISPALEAKGILWLNKIDEVPAMFGNKLIRKRFIDIETIQDTRRDYHSIGIDLPVVLSKHELILLQARLNELLMKRKPVRELHMIDSSNLQIITLWNYFPILFQTLHGLSVTVNDAPIMNGIEVNWNMPNLRHIQWKETKYHSGDSQNPRVLINLYAPRLQKAIFEAPNDMYMENVDYRSILELKTVGHLQELQCVLGRQAIDLLSSNRLPALKRMCLIKEESCTTTDWDIIAHNTPELQKLDMRRDPAVTKTMPPMYSFLMFCPLLTELHLDGLDITEMIDATYLWGGVTVLHLHECLVYVPNDNRKLFSLPDLRKLCISIGLIRQGELVLCLPNVEVLSLSKANETLDILEMPKLHTLHLRVPLRRQMTFMSRRMPCLRDLILDTPSMFLQISELNYRMLLQPMIQLSSLTVICRSGHAINNLLANINREQPALKTLKLIGNGAVSKIGKSTLRSILRLPHLENLMMANIQVTGTIQHPIPLPRDMQRFRVRSVCTPGKSRFVSFKRSQRRLGIMTERKVLHHTFFNINACQIPKFEDVQGLFEICFDQLTNLYPNA